MAIKENFGLFSRFRRGNKKTLDDAKPESATTHHEKSESQTMAEDADIALDINNGNGDVTGNKGDMTTTTTTTTTQLKAVRFPASDALKTTPVHTRRELQKVPTAREAAYGGPPRYDWIDIETSAAIKVQSVVRRNITMKHLEEQGITTAAIRNKSRRREAQQKKNGVTAVVGSGDIPNLLACCGVGLAFGEATGIGYDKIREHEKEEYIERKKQKEMKEAELRKQFQKLSAQKKAAATARGDDIEEVVEVIEEE